MIPLLVLLAGCGPKKTNAVPQSMSLSPSANVHLRNSFDTDPSAYIGRFVPDSSDGAYDESSTMSMSCSQHVSYRRVEGGGVRYNELLEISTAASARLGVPLIADASGSGSTDRVVRVSYELTGKLIGEITDPAAFADCCKASPDQCTRRYIGEFIEGRGAIYHQVANSAQGQGSGVDPSSGVNGNLEFSHGTQWERGVEFPNPVFFAFKISETPYSQQSASSCSSFMVSLPPAADDGVFLLGSSGNPAKDEATARRRAMRSATMESYRALGTTVDPNAPDAALVAPEVQAREWCVETVRTDKGDRYNAKVLAFVKRPDPVAAPPITAQPAAPVQPPTSNSGSSNGSVGSVPSGGFGTPASTGGFGTPASTGGFGSPAAINGGGFSTPAVVNGGGYGTPVAASPGGGGGSIQPAALSQLQASIASAAFSDDKLSIVRTAAANNRFTVAQVAQLLGGFSFDNDKVEAVSILRQSIVDPQNAALLASSFTFSSDKQKVMALFQ